MQLVVLCISH